MPATQLEATSCLHRILHRFINPSQLSTIVTACRGEERQWFFDKIVDLTRLIETMPCTMEQDGLGDEAIVHLHYFCGAGDWWITETDVGEGGESRFAEQHQAFGLADLGDPELGYISIVELVANRVELDLHWIPRTLGQIRHEKYGTPYTPPSPPLATNADHPAVSNLLQQIDRLN